VAQVKDAFLPRDPGERRVVVAGCPFAVVLADPSDELTQLQQEARQYPPRLREALLSRELWEAGFCLDIAGKAVSLSDNAYISGCLFRAVLLWAHALHANAGRWLVNEKGAVTTAGRLGDSPEDLTTHAQAICAASEPRKEELHTSLTAARQLLNETARHCRRI
jgi:hypothetical protein